MNDVIPTSAALYPDLPWHLRVRLVDGLGDRADLALGELTAERLNLALLVGEPEGSEATLLTGSS